ncbi:hypothetical protein HanRHA438_Chr01g0025121 [Helianthus annuus]|nr:hypothetical protein HanHA89_Chr01g0022031 [Helianthus annuus]KAJ0783469.1 hypothetical protein HanLR1_Chr01g0020641 [Helianthus annuus]KAJ0948260.1 hypothetical protein HanRHA438_Chr01g0025121 [Helianthus annuus]
MSPMWNMESAFPDETSSAMACTTLNDPGYKHNYTKVIIVFWIHVQIPIISCLCFCLVATISLGCLFSGLCPLLSKMTFYLNIMFKRSITWGLAHITKC